MELELIKFLQAGSNAFFDVFFKVVSIFASYTGFIIAFVSMFFVNKKNMLTFGVTYGIAILFNYILKIIINKPRPFEVDSTIINKLATTGSSMPSSHTTSIVIILCFVCYLVFKMAKSKITKYSTIILSSIFVVLVAISRMYLGQHYLLDVFVGLIIGVIFSILGILCYNYLEKRKSAK